jgi:hypothetical protein
MKFCIDLREDKTTKDRIAASVDDLDDVDNLFNNTEHNQIPRNREKDDLLLQLVDTVGKKMSYASCFQYNMVRHVNPLAY